MGRAVAAERADATPGGLDWFIAIVLMCLAELQMISGGHWGTWGPERTDAGLLLTALQTAPIAVRRRAPVAVLAVTGLAALAQLLIRVQSADLSTVGVLVAFFTVVARGSRAVGLVLAGLTAVGILVAKALDRPTVFMGTDDLIFIYVQFTIAWVLGATVRGLRLQVVALEHRVARSELDLAAERARIAREVHDVVSHTLSVMLVHASAARAHLDTSPDVARTCLHTIDAVGRRAWSEMRALLRLVRHAAPAPGETPGPAGLRDLESVIQPLRDAGLGVEVVVTGRPRPLPRELDRCAARVVKEALTNALAHAGPVLTRVTVCYAADQLAVTVTNEADRLGIRPHGDPGEGLRGMRERVELLGGRFSAASGDGVFSVDAALPITWPRP